MILLNLFVALRVDQAVDALGCGHRKAHRHRFARRRRQTVLRRLAMHVSSIGIRHDQAGFRREDLTRQTLVKAKNSRSQCMR